MAASNGGTATALGLVLYPTTGNMYTLDPTDFNDPNNAGYYYWKVEDVIAGRIPTISRVIISYFDLGLCNLFVQLSGTVDEGAYQFTNGTYTFGRTVPSGLILTKVIGLSLTAQNLQLNIVRPANAGPIAITKVRLEGHIENQAYA